MAQPMDVNILTDKVLIDISKEVTGVTPKELSVFLGFKATKGEHAQAENPLNLRAAYQNLLSQYVDKDMGGRGIQAANVLGKLFLENKMAACAKVIDKELEKAGIVIPSPADTLPCQDVNPPFLPHEKPELKKAGIVIPSPADTPTRQDVNSPSPPHDKPGSETPVSPTSSGLQPQPRDPSVERQHQRPYFGRYRILAVVFVAIFAVIVYFVNVKVP